MPNQESFDAGPQYPCLQKNNATTDISSAAMDLTNAVDAGKQVIIDDLFITSLVAMNVTVQDTTPTVLLGPLYIPAGGCLPLTLRNGIRGAGIGLKVQLKSDTAGTVKTFCSYHYNRAI